MDMLRGIAVLGILLLNIVLFALPFDAMVELSDVGNDGPSDVLVYAIMNALAAGKFMTMFALLFGAGVALMADKRLEANRPAAGLHYRRIGLLAGIGLFHGIAIWHGDILFAYAITAALLYPILLLRGKALLWACVAAWAAALLIALGFSALFALAESSAGASNTGSRIFQNEIELMRGGVLGILKVRFVHWLVLLIIGIFFMFPWMLALMMTGALAKRYGWITGQRSTRDYRFVLIAGLAVGLPIAMLRTAMHLWWDSPMTTALQMPMFMIDATALCCAWGSAVVLVAPKLTERWLGRAMIAVGRMALTNYLAQSVICTMLFYGYGLGLFAKLSRTELLGVVAGVWLLQLVWSPWWLKRFERGPIESLWRRVTYGKPDAAGVSNAATR
jgi:uncharacterized protein